MSLDTADHEFAFGEAAASPICEHDRKFLERRENFARGEVRLSENGADILTGYRLVRERRFAEAIAVYDRILVTEPGRPEIWVNRGVALQALGRLDEALASFDRALDIKSDYSAGLINRGVVLGWMARNEEALAAYSAALELEPDNEAGRLGRGVILSSLLRLDEALADADYVLERNPGSGAGHYNKALVLLSMGDYAEGFREHEWRFGTDSILGRYQFKEPRWLGQKTAKRILVHCEQGLGDQIQFLRYLPLMQERGLAVSLECPPALIRLCHQLGVPVHTYEERPAGFGYHCPIISLGTIFGTTLDTIPATEGYLKADPAEIERWGDVLGRSPRPRIGLAWSSGVRPEQIIAVTMQKRKSIPTAEIETLLDIPGLSFVSLQKDTPPGGIPARLFDPMPQVHDLADTAGIIANLDLVITVDSAVAHLAGAMGKPVWVLNRADICWRWLSGTREAPWYKSAKIYRQEKPHQWRPMLARVKADLQDEFAWRIRL